MKNYQTLFFLFLTTITLETYEVKRDYLRDNLELVKTSLSTILTEDQIVLEEIEHGDLLEKCSQLFKASEEDFNTNYARLCFTYDQYTLYQSFRATKASDKSINLTYEKNQNLIYELKLTYPNDPGYMNYVCDKKNQDETDELDISKIYANFKIEFVQSENDIKEMKDFSEVAGFFKLIFDYAISGDEAKLKSDVENHLNEDVFNVYKGTKGAFEGTKLDYNGIVEHLKNYVSDQKMTKNCNEIYTDYLKKGDTFLGENVVHLNMLSSEKKKFSITIYEEKDGVSNLYTIEYEEVEEGPEIEVLEQMSQEKRNIVGEVLKDKCEQNFKIFDKGVFHLDLQIEDGEIHSAQEIGEIKQIEYKSVFLALKKNEKAMFCRMRFRNVFALEDSDKMKRSFYSGSWNLIAAPKEFSEGKKCPADVISEFNDEREKISEQEKNFSDGLIEAQEDKKYTPGDFGEGNNYFWLKIAGGGSANPKKNSELFGRKIVDFYLGADLDLSSQPQTDIDKTQINEAIEKHSILLFTRYFLVEENWVGNEFFDVKDDAFMKYKTGNKITIMGKIDKENPDYEFNKVGPYLMANVFTCYGNRASFADKDSVTNEEFLDNYLTKDTLIRII